MSFSNVKNQEKKCIPRRPLHSDLSSSTLVLPYVGIANFLAYSEQRRLDRAFLREQSRFASHHTSGVHCGSNW